MEIFDDRPINQALLPHDSGETVEVLPGVFIPASRESLFWDMADRSPAIKQALYDISFVEVLPGVVVPRDALPEWQQRMATEPEFVSAMDALVERIARENNLNRARTHSVSSHLISYGQQH